MGTHSETIFISDANRYSVVVALLAGVAGMISLTTAKAGALIGVLISVTTIPAAGNIGLAAAYGDWGEFRGASAQLAINLVCIVGAGSRRSRCSGGASPGAARQAELVLNQHKRVAAFGLREGRVARKSVCRAGS